jgi:chlorite dismutase
MAEQGHDEHAAGFDDDELGEGAPGRDGGAAEAGLPQQYVRFAFYRVDPAWRRLPVAEREAHKAELAAVIEDTASQGLLQPYSMVGTRGDCDFMLWHASPDLGDMYSLAARINHTAMAAYLTVAHSYLSVTKRSIYTRGHRHPDQPESRLEVRMGEGAYLVVYPFVKVRPWYKLTVGARQGMMVEHIRIGHKYPQIRIHTTYAVGLDDEEFVLAFDADRPIEFVDLMMELRFSEASAYTLRDTPSFTCRRAGAREALDLIG